MVRDPSSSTSSSSSPANHVAVDSHQQRQQSDAEFEAMVDEAEAADEAELSAFEMIEDDEKAISRVRPPEAPAWGHVAAWIVTSGANLLLTRYITTSLGYNFPVFLGAVQMLGAALGTRALRSSIPSLRSESVDLPRPLWLRSIILLGFLWSASLVLSTAGVAHLSASTVQAFSAFIPPLTLAILVTLKMAQPITPLIGALCVITVGLLMAAGSEYQSTVFGFLCQAGAIFMDPARLVLIQILLQTYSLSPINTLHLYAPVAAILLGLSLPFSEGLSAIAEFANIGFVFLFLSILVAFGAFVAEVFLIEAVGALGGSLSHVLRDVLFALVSSSPKPPARFGGYIVAFVGLCCTLGLSGSTGNSAVGQQVAHLYKRLMSGPGNAEGNAGQEVVSRKFKLIGASAVLAVVAFSSATFSGSGHQVMDGMSPAWTATYPLATVPEPHFDSDRKFTRWTVSGPGQEIIASFDPSIDVARLPRVAWVIVATESEINLYGQQFLQIQCYCARAGISFILEHFIMVDDRHFLTARHRTTAKYLRFYQWVIVTDSDFVVLDSDHDIRSWLDDSVDMILTDRENGEICGCGYMVKNSPGGWSFLQRWVSWADHGKARMNQDNGDLIEMVHAGLKPGSPNNADNSGREINPIQTEDNCLNSEEDWEMYWVMNKCVGKIFNKYRSANPITPYWQETLWAWDSGHPAPTVRIYKPFAGWIRSAGDSQGEWSGMPTTHIGVPGEFMGHGKHLERFLNIDSILCTGKNWFTEPRLSLEEARRYVAEELGYPSYWGCIDESGGYHCSQYQRSKTHPVRTEGNLSINE